MSEKKKKDPKKVTQTPDQRRQYEPYTKSYKVMLEKRNSKEDKKD